MGWSQPTQILEFVGIPCHLVLLWMLPWVFGFAIVSRISFSFFFGAGSVDDDCEDSKMMLPPLLPPSQNRETVLLLGQNN